MQDKDNNSKSKLWGEINESLTVDELIGLLEEHKEQYSGDAEVVISGRKEAEIVSYIVPVQGSTKDFYGNERGGFIPSVMLLNGRTDDLDTE